MAEGAEQGARAERRRGAAPNIPHALEMDQDVTLTVKGSVVAIQDGSNQDGTVNCTYKLKAAEVEVT